MSTRETQVIDPSRSLGSRKVSKSLKRQRSSSPISPTSPRKKQPKSSSYTAKSVNQVSTPSSASSSVSPSTPSPVSYSKRQPNIIAKRQTSPISKKSLTSTAPPATINNPNILPEEIDSRSRHNLVEDWISRCDIDQESVGSNNMSDVISLPPPSDLSSANVYQSRVDLVGSNRYRVIDLHRLKIHMVKPQEMRLPPEWLCGFVKHASKVPVNESKPVVDQLRVFHTAILSAATADDEDDFDGIYDRILAGLQLDAEWPNTKICTNLLFSLRAIVQDPTGNPQYNLSIPKPAVTVGYGSIAFQDVPIAYNSDTQRNFTINNGNSLWAPYLIVETTKDSVEYAAINRLLGGVSSCINVNRRVLTRKNAVFGLCLHNSAASLYATWFDSGDYNTRFVKSFALMEFSQFVLLRRYIHHIILWGSNDRLQNIKEIFNSGNLPEPETPPSPAPAMTRSMPPLAPSRLPMLT